MREVWVDIYGIIHEGGNHADIAQKLFPQSPNPELSCEKLNYIKFGMGFSNSPFMECPNPNKVTQAQTNTIDKLWKEHYKS